MDTHDERLERERVFHDERYARDSNTRAKAAKYYSIMGNARNQYISLVSKYCSGKKLLEYGCGVGDGSLEWLKLGAIVTGIDISGEAIHKSKEIVSRTEYVANYYVMNAEKTDFNDNSFDLVVGTGILHHLELNNSYAELCRILRSDGHGIFIEPLGQNPVINLYRWLTPTLRSDDEHPLKDKDIELLTHYFGHVETYYYNLCTLLAVPFRNKTGFRFIYSLLDRVDRTLFTMPWLKTRAWMVVLHVSKPNKRKSALSAKGGESF